MSCSVTLCLAPLKESLTLELGRQPASSSDPPVSASLRILAPSHHSQLECVLLKTLFTFYMDDKMFPIFKALCVHEPWHVYGDQRTICGFHSLILRCEFWGSKLYLLSHFTSEPGFFLHFLILVCPDKKISMTDPVGLPQSAAGYLITL